jgi:hypothetical protein
VIAFGRRIEGVDLPVFSAMDGVIWPGLVLERMRIQVTRAVGGVGAQRRTRGSATGRGEALASSSRRHWSVHAVSRGRSVHLGTDARAPASPATFEDAPRAALASSRRTRHRR